MTSRASMLYLFLLFLLLAPQLDAKDKKKQLLPDYVLRAERVLVVIHPDASEGVTNPMANRMARDDVERAITKWGRFNLVMDANTAQLIIALRKGTKSGPIISHSPVDDRPVMTLPSGGVARVGQRPGYPPLTEPLPRGVGDRGPQLGSQIGSSEDTFEVYLGGGEFPLDASPVWRYTAQDSINAPHVAAVEQFRKAIEESEKQRHQKP